MLNTISVLAHQNLEAVMFNWFKKKKTPRTDEVPPIFKQFIEPMALATALAETIADYVRAVDSGKVSVPAYERKGDNVVGIWGDTRLEALRCLWGYGASDAMLLADYRQQKKLLDDFFEGKPQYEFPHHPSGEAIHDTLQALFQVYLFLGKAGTAVADKETDSTSLELANKSIFSDFEEKASKLRVLWNGFESAPANSSELPEMPSTLLDLLYKDVTKKAKGIALSAQFGPNYESNMQYLVKRVEKDIKEQGDSEQKTKEKIEKIQNTMRSLLEADDPDHVT